MYTIAIGCDPNAYNVKNLLLEHVDKLGHKVIDFGSNDPIYANTAIAVAEYVASGQADRGILLCGTGIGVSIAANKVKGAYAALLTDAYSAERAVKSNNTNIACFGAFTTGHKLIELLVDIWLTSEYNCGTPSEDKIRRFVEYDYTR